MSTLVFSLKERGQAQIVEKEKKHYQGSTRRFDPDSGKKWSQCSRKMKNRQGREVTKIKKEK